MSLSIGLRILSLLCCCIKNQPDNFASMFNTCALGSQHIITESYVTGHYDKRSWFYVWKQPQQHICAR